MKQSRRIAAFVLAAAMVFSALPMNALAAETQKAALGPCEHHPEHTADCGYAQAVPESPCSHTHGESCYTLATQCIHTHTEECYPAAVTDEAAAPAAEPAGCTHQCSEESGCVTKALACTHKHDDQCGYAPGVAEQPCTFSCTVCNAQKQEEPAVPECICETPCTAEAVNQECPVCGVENGDLTQCQGTPAQEEPSCTCTEACTAEAVNQDCPVCGAENADLTQCKGKAPDEQVKAAQALVDALPTVEELEAMTPEEQRAVYEKLQAAYAAYQALTPEQQAQITGAEKLDSLLAFFADQVNALANVKYLDANGNEQTADNVTVVASNMTTWQSGWYVVNSDVTIRSRVTVSGEVHLILADGASLTVDGGINVAESDSFSVYAQSVGGNMGTLTAIGGGYAAGIGGGNNGPGGNIAIYGGSIAATGSYYAAGIGGGDNGSGGTVIIYGGTVNATGKWAAGIGGGNHGSGGTVTIHGGTVTATGDYCGAGIGGGHSGFGGTVTIHGGSVTAISGGYAAGIGGGYMGSGGTVTIYSGSVEATGKSCSAGIGGGAYRSGGTVTIYSSTVTATGGRRGSGIGGGEDASGGTVTIHGGTVTATGGENGTGIGDGADGSGSTFTTEEDGHALIVANGGIGDKSQQASWSGIIFDGSDGKVYKDQTLQENFEIPSGKTLTVPENATLTVNNGVTITCNGTLTNNGTIAGGGTLDGDGNLAGSGTVVETIANNLKKIRRFPSQSSRPRQPTVPK